MGKYIIRGGKRISGRLRINGCKNAALPILAATVLNHGQSIIHNCPEISDITVASQILENIGCTVKRDNTVLLIDSSEADNSLLKPELVRQMRCSIVFLGSLLGRFKEAEIAYPGGCAIGERPINLHKNAMLQMGAEMKDDGNSLYGTASKLIGTEIVLPIPSVGATENIMLAAVLAKGFTTIQNAAKEPEIKDLQSFLNSMGAKVSGAGTYTIIIEGVSGENLHDTEYSIMPDRIEAGTFLTAAAITGGKIELTNVCPEHIESIMDSLKQAGCKFDFGQGLYCIGPKRPIAIPKIITKAYPGFPTDMQPQVMSMLTLAKGTSIIIETVFEARDKHIPELRKMGASIQSDGRKTLIQGVSHLTGAEVASGDLRAGAALILAGLAAQGETIVTNSCYIERGYQGIDTALKALGADICYAKDDF